MVSQLFYFPIFSFIAVIGALIMKLQEMIVKIFIQDRFNTRIFVEIGALKFPET
jgi:hypothetical protein